MKVHVVIDEDRLEPYFPTRRIYKIYTDKEKAIQEALRMNRKNMIMDDGFDTVYYFVESYEVIK